MRLTSQLVNSAIKVVNSLWGMLGGSSGNIAVKLVNSSKISSLEKTTNMKTKGSSG